MPDSTLDLDKQRATLEQMREEFTQRLTEATANELELDESTAENNENVVDSVDTADASVNSEEQAAIVGEAQRQLADIDAALQRLADGTYGRCVVDDKWIGDERLSALPATPYCIEDAERLAREA